MGLKAVPGYCESTKAAAADALDVPRLSDNHTLFARQQVTIGTGTITESTGSISAQA